MSMDLSHEEAAPGTVVIRIGGKLIMPATGDRIVNLVETLLGEGKRKIVFDLAHIAAIDSTGIGQFIASYNKIAAAGGEMRMAAATGHVFQTFHVSLLDQVFRFYPSIEEATRA